MFQVKPETSVFHCTKVVLFICVITGTFERHFMAAFNLIVPAPACMTPSPIYFSLAASCNCPECLVVLELFLQYLLEKDKFCGPNQLI